MEAGAVNYAGHQYEVMDFNIGRQQFLLMPLEDGDRPVWVDKEELQAQIHDRLWNDYMEHVREHMDAQPSVIDQVRDILDVPEDLADVSVDSIMKGEQSIVMAAKAGK